MRLCCANKLAGWLMSTRTINPSKPPAAEGFNPGRMAQDIRFPTADTREKNTLFKLKSEVAPAGGPPGPGHCAAATGPTGKRLAYK